MESTISDSIKDNMIFEKSNKVEFRDEANGQYLIFNLNTHESLIINETGKFIFENCNGRNSICEIINLINNAFTVNSEDEVEILTRIRDFIKLCEIKGLVSAKQ